MGRFVQADTIVPEPGNPQALNRYSHVLNNPLRYTDPTGRWVFEEEPEDPFIWRRDKPTDALIRTTELIFLPGYRPSDALEQANRRSALFNETGPGTPPYLERSHPVGQRALSQNVLG
ncbi:MAG TPA: hypothetical protein EYP55_04565 [Anaerolineae bacterium]|nr:hypothetical protein [Anaerolineae bacterium]